jgi:hypothetical protein
MVRDDVASDAIQQVENPGPSEITDHWQAVE